MSSDVICFCCHTGWAVTLLPVGYLVFMGNMVSENSPFTHTHLFKLFTEDKLRMATSAVRRLLIDIFMQTLSASLTTESITASVVQHLEM